MRLTQKNRPTRFQQYAARALAVLVVMLACNACVTLVDAARQNNMTEVSRLLAEGANPNGPPGSCYSPLMIAAGKDNVALAQLLLDKGANVNLKSPQCYEHGDLKYPIKDNTALLFSRTPEMATLLLAKGADLNAVNSKGRNALDESLEALAFEAVKFFFEKGLRPTNAKSTFFRLGGSYFWSTVARFKSPVKSENSYRIAEYLIKNGIKPKIMPLWLDREASWKRYGADREKDRMVLLYKKAGAVSAKSDKKQ